MAYRKEKLEELIKRIVSDLIMQEIKDPRIGFVSLTGVSLSNDKKSAKIGVSILGSNKERRNAYEGLKSATGYIQHKLGKSIKLRHTPKINFFLDSSVSDGVELVDFLEKIVDSEDTEDTEDNSAE